MPRTISLGSFRFSLFPNISQLISDANAHKNDEKKRNEAQLKSIDRSIFAQQLIVESEFGKANQL